MKHILKILKLMRRFYVKYLIIFVLLTYGFPTLIQITYWKPFNGLKYQKVSRETKTEYTKEPIIFIGGYARSGTTLMR